MRWVILDSDSKPNDKISKEYYCGMTEKRMGNRWCSLKDEASNL